MIEVQNIFPTPIGYLSDIGFTNKVLPIAEEILERTGKHRWGYTTTFGDEKVRDQFQVYGQIYLLPYIKLTHSRVLNGDLELIIGWLKFLYL